MFWFFLTSCFFIFFYCNFCLALEVEFPTLPTGEAPPSGTDLPSYFLYLYYFGVWFGFGATIFSLVVAGGLYLLSNAFPSLKTLGKDWLSGALKGFTLLLLTYLIVTTINPALRLFEIREKLKEPPPPTTEEEESAGVYFYVDSGCPTSEESEYLPAATASISDLGQFKNRVKSVKIVQKPEDELYYIAILYDAINFWGKCEDIDPYSNCAPIEPFAASASIYQWSFESHGDGVTFYRKPFYDESGGWYKVENSQIKGGYTKDLKKLKFKNVPENEQNCTEWDIKGKCLNRELPALDDQNIASIKIDGDYAVFLLSPDVSPDDSFCQAFPTMDDINKEGPKQIKWEMAFNRQYLPDIVVIFPIVNK